MSWSLALVLCTIWLGPPFLAVATWLLTRSWRRAALNAALTLGALTVVIVVSRRPLEVADPGEIVLTAVTFLPALLLTGFVLVIVRTFSTADAMR